MYIYTSFSSALYEVKWLASSYSRSTPGEMAASVNTTGEWVAPRFSLKSLRNIEVRSYQFQ
jgi:hypothetical protein